MSGTASDRSQTPSEHGGGIKRNLQPSSRNERLRQKIDKLTEEQAAAGERNESQFQAMMSMFDKQHEERMSVMTGLMKAIGGKGKRGKPLLAANQLTVHNFTNGSSYDQHVRLHNNSVVLLTLVYIKHWQWSQWSATIYSCILNDL